MKFEINGKDILKESWSKRFFYFLISPALMIYFMVMVIVLALMGVVLCLTIPFHLLISLFKNQSKR